MSHSALASFDPLAVHPFTNTSGLMPKPMPPSQYPHLLPSPSSTMSSPSSSPTPSMVSPQPQRASPSKRSTGSARGPVFVPFRPERSSPDLDDILLKKKVSDALSNKQTWSIDNAPVVSTRGSRR